MPPPARQPGTANYSAPFPIGDTFEKSPIRFCDSLDDVMAVYFSHTLPMWHSVCYAAVQHGHLGGPGRLVLPSLRPFQHLPLSTVSSMRVLDLGVKKLQAHPC